jgi:hypothetical protein
VNAEPSRNLQPATDSAELLEVVRRLAGVFGRRNVRHALIGGLAVSLRSRPRTTKDADFIIDIPALSFPAVLEELIAEGFEINVADLVRRWSTDRFAVFYRGDARIDWMQPILPLYAHVIDAAESLPWSDTTINVATAEGLILTKMAAFRLQDQVDVETLLSANRDSIDVALIRKEWSVVSDGEDARTAWLEDAIHRLAPKQP